ncbi:MAG: hypothetical protein HRU18_26795 [Pseudoalteromonas sp.]|uniref:hypothetical protein n=1 Tax=Pseudoalteromonas sp. TaxID=53249 RepID=UPI001D67BD7B|nr:hypothetical protein [Pseudoalteromonas sp.]NRA81821.1 hypothetical protein [Pseudoalteromonas sp.]
MAISGGLSSISDSADNIDGYVILATERGDFGLLKPIREETESIRSKAKEVRREVEGIMEEKAELEKRLNEEEKMIWVDLAYQFAPLVIGILFLIWGKLTNDPRDTIAGVVAFFVGSAMTALHHIMGDWGILCITGFGLFYYFQKNSLDKQVKSTTLNDLNKKGTSQVQA